MKLYFSIFLTFLYCNINAQFDHESVFNDLEGENLRSALVNTYKTNSVLSYSQARDTFFSKIDAIDNKLECVYTGYTITLDPSQDPTVFAFGLGINTEHTYPRSKGALENTLAYSDMHHLFPTRANVNSHRGSLPFQNIIDSQTDKWFLNANIVTSIPNNNIDGYSEILTGEGFEPREKHKGDVARAYFYFYTMYQSQADQTAPNFFGLQVNTLCEWMYQDPVDEKEWNRNKKIAAYQGGYKNPFILDCRLARLYCDDVSEACKIVNTQNVTIERLMISPNPANATVNIISPQVDINKVSIVSISGQVIASVYPTLEGDNLSIDVSYLKKGMYILLLHNQNGTTVARSKFIKI
ncbi:MAG: endonuclease [Saprospiraceae bacterium]